MTDHTEKDDAEKPKWKSLGLIRFVEGSPQRFGGPLLAEAKIAFVKKDTEPMDEA